MMNSGENSKQIEDKVQERVNLIELEKFENTVYKDALLESAEMIKNMNFMLNQALMMRLELAEINLRHKEAADELESVRTMLDEKENELKELLK